MLFSYTKTNLNPNHNPKNPNHNHSPRTEIAWSRSYSPSLDTENIIYGVIFHPGWTNIHDRHYFPSLGMENIIYAFTAHTMTYQVLRHVPRHTGLRFTKTLRELPWHLPRHHVRLRVWGFWARRDSIEPNSYGDVAGWLGGCLSQQPVLYQNETTELTLKLFRPSDSPIIEAFGAPYADTKFQGEPLHRGRLIHWGRKNWRFSTYIAVYLGNGAR